MIIEVDAGALTTIVLIALGACACMLVGAIRMFQVMHKIYLPQDRRKIVASSVAWLIMASVFIYFTVMAYIEFSCYC